MALEARDLKAGTRLLARYKGTEHAAEVVQTDDGLRFRLEDGTEHKSPSSAGKAVMGGVACNGWRFWSLEGDLPAGRERKTAAAKPATKAKGNRAKAAKKGGKAKKARPRAAAMKSRASYGCGACGAEFPTMKAATKHALTHTSS